MRRREFMAGCATAVLASLPYTSAVAQDYPSKPIRWVVGYPAGGGTDSIARTLANLLQPSLGQPLIVDNRPGASTSLAAQSVAAAPPDGYTIFSADNATLVNNPAMFAKLPYDPQKDFAPITTIGRGTFLLVVNPAFPAKDLRSFVELLKREPGKFNYASPGKGTPHHLAMEMFKHKVGVAIDDVPYKGAAPAIQDILGGQVPVMMLDVGSAAPHVKGGKLKALTVFRNARLPAFDQVPAISEFGFKDLEIFGWQGVVAPAGTPKPVIAKLSADLRKVIESPEAVAKLSDMGIEPFTTTPEQYAARIQADAAAWQPLIKSLGIRLD